MSQLRLFATLLLVLSVQDLHALAVTSAVGRVSAGGDARIVGFEPAGGEVAHDWTGTPADLSASFQAVSPGLVGIAVSTSIVEATWDTTGLAGRISTLHAFVFQTGGETNFTASFRRPSWTYSFTPDEDVDFSLAYDITAEFNTFGLNSYNFVINGVDRSLTAVDGFLQPSGSGVFSTRLAGGVGHVLELYTNGNIAAFAPGGHVGIQRGEFSFSLVQVVPEPSAAALAMLGLGALLGSQRRRATRRPGASA